MTARVGIGLAGLGHLGRFQATNLATKVACAELVHVVDTVSEIAGSVGRELEVDWSTDYEALLDDPRVVGVVIVTPTPLHAEMIERAAAAGKHVFAEKPMAHDLESHRRALDAVEAAGVILQVGFHRRFDPDYVAVRRAIEAGELGEVHVFRSCHRQQAPPAAGKYAPEPGGLFVDSLIHDFDTARWFVGDVSEVASLGGSRGGEAMYDVFVTCRFESGAIGIVDGSRHASYGFEASAEVVGSKGTARISKNGRDHVEVLSAGRATHGLFDDFRERFRLAYMGELEAFARSIVSGTPAGCGGRDAIAAFVVAQAAARSYETGHPVEVGLGSRLGGG